MIKLSPAQTSALEKMKDGEWHRAYELDIMPQTIWSLQQRDLVEFKVESGYLWRLKK